MTTNITENTVVEDIAEVKAEETETIENIVKPIISRKRNYKVDAE